jgi:UDP-3-O-[3-hydroxymyristoyl] glucosamine N-acyltransferase
VHIGAHTRLHPGVAIYHDCVLEIASSCIPGS